MGLDYSAHPVDPELFRSRLIPYAMGRGDITDLLDRAVQVAFVRERAAVWRANTYALHDHMLDQQREVAPTVTHTYEVEGEQSAADRLLGRPAPKRVESYEAKVFVPGMPGLDTDLHIWGRPFFNTEQDVTSVLAAHRSFLAVTEQRVPPIDAICRRMVASLEAHRSQTPADLDKGVLAVLNATPPYLSFMEDDDFEDKDDMASFDRDALRKAYHVHWNFIRELWDRRTAKAAFNVVKLEKDIRVAAGLPPNEENPGWVDVSPKAADPDNDPRDFVSAHEALRSLPFRIMMFASLLEPGWMGQGSAYASSAFPRIGVNAEHLFETPAPLFRELAAAAPTVGKDWYNSIADNFSLGGYVPPEKVPLLVDRLDKNRDKLVRAWVGGEPTEYDLKSGLTDFLKNLEPAMYAASRGSGYLEAAEIYSGFLGMTN